MKRRLLKLAVFLLLGAIVNVAVAWFFVWQMAVTVDKGYLSALDDSFGSWPPNRPQWSVSRTKYRHVLLFGMSDHGPNWDFSHETDPTIESWLPKWSYLRTRLPAALANQPSLHFNELAAGWPLISLRTYQQWRLVPPFGQTQIVRQGRAVTMFWRDAASTDELLLPAEPIWGNFAINTLFYAAILWLLFAAPFALRRWRRVRRGQCPACGYPVGESAVCTECGGKVSIGRGKVRERMGLPPPATPRPRNSLSRVVAPMLLCIAMDGCGQPPAENQYVGLTESEVRDRFDNPIAEFAGHYGNPPLSFTEQFGRDIKTLVFDEHGGDLYASFEKRGADWIVIRNSWLPEGGDF